MTLTKEQASALLIGVTEWCEAVQRGTGWDDWDHCYKAMCYDLLPALGIKVRDEAEQEHDKMWGALTVEQRARIAERVA
jgi:hypothetical protein